MARRRKGRDISGWLLIDKPAGPTSNDVVGKVRWAFHARKAGHAGTLDPAATGLLAIALGEATKTVPYVTDAMKAYDFVIRLGVQTDTDDADGTPIATSDMRPKTPEIATALDRFRGNIEQVPPQYSAVKVDGARSYSLARAGAAAPLEARPLYVESLEILERSSPDVVSLRMVCGKGGYVRSVARDLGLELGCLGHVQSLRRIWSGAFDVRHAVTLDRIEAAARTPSLDDLLLPLETALEGLPRVQCGAVETARLRNGNPVPVLSSEAEFGDEAWACCGGRAIALGTYRAGTFHPSRVIKTPGATS
ncbi:MAG: tRNA pseudouridine(55) synthase TruB [Pseudomonadota bacterium]